MEKQIDPRMHSAEHILNRTMIRLFGCDRAFSAHIEKRKSKCDYRFGRPLGAEEVGRIEEQVNAVIRAGLPVTAALLDREEARRRFDLKRLPPQTDGRIRIVSVGEYDACPCSGLHVAATSEIGVFRIISTSFEAGVLRIRYRLNEDLASGNVEMTDG
jgi:misacylated tRNA(Ala) deacylase